MWTGCGPEPRQVYQAIRIPQVKCGVLIVDANDDHVVGKAFLDEKRKEPRIKIVAGADVASVVALASALLGDF